jgi:hypothetical protein
MERQIVYLHPSKSRERALMLNHLLPGLLLLLTGIEVLMGDAEEHVPLPWLNIIVGLAALLYIIYEFRFSHHKKHTAVHWVDIIAGFVLLLEGINHYHPNKIFQPALFYSIIGVLTFLLGIFHNRVGHLRRLVTDGNGFMIRTSPIRKIEMQWRDIVSMSFGESTVDLVLSGNRKRRINLRKTGNKDEIAGIFKKIAAEMKIAID